MSSNALAAYTLTQKKMESITNIIAPQNMHQNTLLIGLPPRIEGTPVFVVVIAVPKQKRDEDQNRATSYASGDKVVPMKTHQHVCIL